MKSGGSIWNAAKDESDPETLGEVYRSIGDIYKQITTEVGKVVVGQKDVLDEILVAILTDNHALLEGYPGLGKTLLVKTLSDIMHLQYRRIQCTPDLMPSDITGTYLVEDDEKGRKSFRFEKGPVFTNILLADEINRSTPKSQSALLESMQERQVTLGTETHSLPKPFLVLATQNPLEMEGTYPLPEAQIDRFLLKIMVDYPKAKEEEQIIDLYTSESRPSVRKILNQEKIVALQTLVRKMPISEEIRNLTLKIVTSTRPGGKGLAAKYVDYGASPRASIGLVLAAKAKALLSGRNFVSKKDVTDMAYPVLRHRIILNFESERKGFSTDDVIRQLLEGI